jgi:hypothetical protein
MIFNEKFGDNNIIILGLNNSNKSGIDLNGFYTKSKDLMILVEENAIEKDCKFYNDFKKLIIKNKTVANTRGRCATSKN